MLSAYVEHGFADAPDGTITLKCTPETEAQVFEASGKPLISEMGSVDAPAVIACGSRDIGPGPADFAPAIAQALPAGRLLRYDHIGHFGPFQDPDTLAEDAIAAFTAD